ncbi:MAG: protein-L-isoaspartate O-methyltransferase [Candidatus Thermoplasmatota archaeon]|nr:protein-L-isoaspartate O-methyltransferase [Candidatus Thermoplasmatota archaeon]
MDFSEKRKRLVDGLKKQGYIRSNTVERGMLSVPRELFIPKEKKTFAYVDRPIDIGNNQTISAPHMVAIMTEVMQLSSGQQVLEIGTGSGYHAAVVSSIVGKQGHVYSIERFENLAEVARQRLKKSNVENVSVVVGDGSLGLDEFAPYDRIYVTCSAPSVPDPLKKQVSVGGRIIIPVGRITGQLLVLTKEKTGFHETSYGGCAFVPLIGKYGFDD